MAIYSRCDKSVADMAKGIIEKYEEHKALEAAKLKIDFVFAFGEEDKEGNVKKFPIKVRGQRALAQTRNVNLKNRALGRGDVEILLDGNWWKDAGEKQQIAVLDHELTHIEVLLDENAKVATDDLNRPKIKLKHHDFELGFFVEVAKRHGTASVECMFAAAIMEESGQYLWPDLVGQGKKLLKP